FVVANCRSLRLTDGGDPAGADAERQQEKRERRDFVAPDELRCEIDDGVVARGYRQAFPVTFEIVCELLDGTVAALRLLAQRHGDDRFQVAAKLTPEPRVRPDDRREARGFL